MAEAIALDRVASKWTLQRKGGSPKVAKVLIAEETGRIGDGLPITKNGRRIPGEAIGHTPRTASWAEIL